MHSLNIFGARMNHGQTQIHKISHGSNLAETTTFPLIILFLPSHGVNMQMSFCPGTPKILIVGIPATLGAHNFVFKIQIEMRSEAKL